MAKRFTDTGKWAKASFGDLSIKMKLVWIYLCDNCDHAGIWDINLKLMAFHLGEPVTMEEIEKGLGDKIKALSSSKLFIPSFIDFQYGVLNPENRAHKSVLDRLEKEGANKVLTRSSQGRKDKDKDKDKDKESRESAERDAAAVYKEYPRKMGKADGIKTLVKRLMAGLTLQQTKDALTRFKAHHKTAGTAKEFLPYFSTFVNDLDDWLDPETGQAEDFSDKPENIHDIQLPELGAR